MGWLNFEAPEHEGYLVAPVDNGRGRTRELGLDDPDQPIEVVQVGCECGWRSHRIHAPFSARFAPSIVIAPEDFEERAMDLWRAHVDGMKSLPDDPATRAMFTIAPDPPPAFRLLAERKRSKR